VQSILAVEKKPKFNDDLEDNWYFYLYNRMVEGFKTTDSYKLFGDNKVTFVTFNYDRSLEHYFFECLRNTFRKVPETALVEQMNRIKIHHVYGQVDYLPWQGSKKPYGSKYSYDDVLGITHNIKTMFERSESETEIVKDNIKRARSLSDLTTGLIVSSVSPI
jgi:hypothetical protein